MTRIAVLLAVAAVCAGCAQADFAVNYVEDKRVQQNDLQARVWQLMSCDLSLGGVRRELDPIMKRAVLEHCLQEAAPPE